jgi:MobA/VirD2-like, nuclease domain
VIGKIRKGASFGGLARYLYGLGRREEHKDPRTVAGGNVLLGDPRTWRDWVADMRFCAGHRPDVARPVWHCSLRTAPEDPVLDDARWAAIAAQHIAAMGLAGHPWVAVRHGDDHLHIVACRVDAGGRVWRDSHDYARSMRSCRQLEHDHRLTVLTHDRPTGRYATTTAAERARAARHGVDPHRARLREAMHAARTAAAGAGIARWEDQLAAHGVLYQAKATRDGTIIGYRVSLPGWTDPRGEQVWLKASPGRPRLVLATDTTRTRRRPARSGQA